ncbi:hypothetical protein BGE01nite_40990 [Brevifollis gellanilyticus]|uniref:Uncharacterized protein n=1 Tax=Brevifollis gellanilyticus TaxID=748831 RepID=A0A512MDM3_9BACT|nr:hypothetical protein BGE01nite_40990 [Brevifollis gellanilyticus]
MVSASIGINFLLPSLHIKLRQSLVELSNLVRSVLPIFRDGRVTVTTGFKMPVVKSAVAAWAGVVHGGEGLRLNDGG